MFIEQRLEHLTEVLTKFQVDMADRLARIETKQGATTDQLAKMNGSVAKSVERIGQIEADDRLAAQALAAIRATQEVQTKEIGKLKHDSTYAKGKSAGIALAVSAAASGLAALLSWMAHHFNWINP
jgi:hypothetical protein